MEERKFTQKDVQFGRRLQRIRKRSGLTQAELAEKTRLSITFIALVETGKRRLSMKSLNKIASALKIKPKELL